MADSLELLYKTKKASKLTRMMFRKNGPKSFKRGMGTLLATLAINGDMAQRELTSKIGIDRANLKAIVMKARKNEYVTVEETEEEHVYLVKLTDLGRELAEKRLAKQEEVADEVLAPLTDEERAQLDAICEKIIVSLKEKGINAKAKGHKHGKKHHHHHHCK